MTKSFKAIDERVFINFRDKNAIFTNFRAKNAVFTNCSAIYLYLQYNCLANSLYFNKLASLEATLVQNSADLLTYLLTRVKCRATSVAKKK